jgi:hypothetical protein
MDDPNDKSPRAGGALLAGAILLGALIGVLLHEPTIGMLAGLGVGLVLLLAVWLIEKRR